MHRFNAEVCFHSSGITAQECEYWVAQLVHVQFLKERPSYFPEWLLISYYHQKYIKELVYPHSHPALVFGHDFLKNFRYLNECIVIYHSNYNLYILNVKWH